MESIAEFYNSSTFADGLVPDSNNLANKLSSVNVLRKYTQDKAKGVGCYLKVLNNAMPLAGGYIYIKEIAGAKTRKDSLRGSTLFGTRRDRPTTQFDNFGLDQSADNVKTEIAEYIIRKALPKTVDFNTKTYAESLQILGDQLMTARSNFNMLEVMWIDKAYITEFKIKTDEYGIGHSIIEDSITLGKIYTLLMLANVSSELNDRPIQFHHINTSGLRNDIPKIVQQVIKAIADTRMSLNDVIGFEHALNKFNARRSFMIPTSKTGTKLLEIENIDIKQGKIDTETLDTLKQLVIAGCGAIPSAILSGSQEAEFSRKVLSSNIIFNNQINSIVTSIAPSLEELYRKILVSEQLIDYNTLEFNFSNIIKFEDEIDPEGIEKAINLAEFITNSYTFTDKKDSAKFKTKLIRNIIPELNWQQYDSIYNKIIEKTHDDLIKNEKPAEVIKSESEEMNEFEESSMINEDEELIDLNI